MPGNFPEANIASKPGKAYRTRLSLLGEVEKLGESPNFGDENLYFFIHIEFCLPTYLGYDIKIVMLAFLNFFITEYLLINSINRDKFQLGNW